MSHQCEAQKSPLNGGELLGTGLSALEPEPENHIVENVKIVVSLRPAKVRRVDRIEIPIEVDHALNGLFHILRDDIEVQINKFDRLLARDPVT
ncbi:MAG: hypothetical protein OXG15_01430 [Gammaproteobacteria bacterium]|nr:hypothetical protein [Gammaproteobacteria bacterium]